MVTVNQVGYYGSPAAEVGQLMTTINKPWIGFKTLGAGRENPPGGFRHAFQRGAERIEERSALTRSEPESAPRK